MLVLFLFLFEIAEAGAVGDGRLAVDRPAGEQHRIDQRRLSDPAVAGNQDVANIRGGVAGHEFPPHKNKELKNGFVFYGLGER